MKRLIPLFLILTLVLSLSACGDSSAANGNSTGSGSDKPSPSTPSSVPDVITEEFLRAWPESDPADFTFSPDGEGVRVDAYNGSDLVVAVPASVDGKPVVSAAVGVFGGAKNSAVRAVRFPASVKYIAGTFSVSDNIEMVICEGVETLGKKTFYSCSKLHTLILGDALKTIELYGISNCNALEALYLSTAPELTGTALDGCPKLTIIGPAGSAAEGFAQAHNIPFQAK